VDLQWLHVLREKTFTDLSDMTYPFYRGKGRERIQFPALPTKSVGEIPYIKGLPRVGQGKFMRGPHSGCRGFNLKMPSKIHKYV
jgi:hypothetical protein